MKYKHKFLSFTLIFIGMFFFCTNRALATSLQELIDNANRELQNFQKQVLDDSNRRIDEANARNQREVNDFSNNFFNEQVANNQRLTTEAQANINWRKETLKQLFSKGNARTEFIQQDLLKRQTALKEKASSSKEKVERQTLADNAKIKQLEQRLSAQVESTSANLAKKIDLTNFANKLNNPAAAEVFSCACCSGLREISDQLNYQIILKELENRAAQVKRQEN